MTINKSQNQSIEYVGIVLTQPVFLVDKHTRLCLEVRTSVKLEWCSMTPPPDCEERGRT